MKYCIVILDGIADEEYVRLQNKTPLEIARTPNMDIIASKGRMGIVKTIPDKFPKESLIAVMSLTGLDPTLYYTGKGNFIAKKIGITLAPTEWAFCCDFVSTFEGSIVDYTAGSLREEEAKLLINDLNKYFNSENIKFYYINKNRNLLIIKNHEMEDLKTYNLFNIAGEPMKNFYPKGKGSEILINIMEKAHLFLEEHEINKIRQDLGENMADSIWIWDGGKEISLPLFKDLFDKKGGIISPYLDIQGYGLSIGLDVIDVPNITGEWNSNFKGKVQKSIEALKNGVDIMYIYVGAILNVSRLKDVVQKVRIIEKIDKVIIGELIKLLEKEFKKEGFRLMIVGGHLVKAKNGKSYSHPVPFAVFGNNIIESTKNSFNEKYAFEIDFYIKEGKELIKFLLEL